MKMFLTRLGFGSRMVITGDATQRDLPAGKSSLHSIRGILQGLSDIAFVELGTTDVVRHSLVARIVAAYEASENGNSLASAVETPATGDAAAALASAVETPAPPAHQAPPARFEDAFAPAAPVSR
jgi:hypothetical protein